MKKILLLLSSFILVTSSVTTSISCNNKKNKENKHKDSFGNSIWTWIPGLKNGKITSPDVWNELTWPFTDITNNSKNWNINISQWDGPTQIQQAIQIMQILSVSILSNSDKLVSESQKNDLYNIADYKDLIEILKDQWKILKESVKQQIKNKKQSFKNDYQKKWKEKYHEWLDNNYPDINNNTSSDKKYEIEENNYSASLMTQGGENVTSAYNILANVLLNNNMRQYNMTNSTTINNLLEDFNNYLKNSGKPKEWNKDNPSLRDNLAAGYSWNEGKGGILGYNKFDEDIQNYKYVNNKLENIAEWLKISKYNLSVFAQNYHSIDAPIFSTKQINPNNKTRDLTLNNQTFQVGMLSMFQKYIIENWYQNEKPVAVSQVTYPFKDSASAFKGGIKPNDFTNNVQEDITTDINNLESTSWENFYKNKSNSGITNSSQNLITLSNSDSLFNSNVIKANIYQNFNKQPDIAPKEIKEIIEAINRSNDNKMSAVWKLGNSDKVIAFIDTDGLHLLHIDGNEFLLDTKRDCYNNYNLEWQLDSLGYSHNVYENINYNPLKDIIYNKKDQIRTNSRMNSHFQSTPYLQYLINMSIAKKRDPNIRIQFDILKQVQSYAKSNIDSSNASTTWWSWIYDFFDNFETKILKIPNKNWLKIFITFKNPDGTISDMKWFKNIVNAMKSTLIGNPYNKLTSIVQTENDTIRSYTHDQPTGMFNIKSILDNIKIDDSKSLPGNIWYVRYKNN